MDKTNIKKNRNQTNPFGYFLKNILCFDLMAEDLKIYKVNLGKRIKALREKKGLTQPELAALLNKDYQTLGRIENGRINPSSYIVYQIAKALDVSINEIFDFSKIN